MKPRSRLEPIFYRSQRVFWALFLSLGSLLSPSPVAAEEPLGRLFFTPERRQSLDYQRQSNTGNKLGIIEDAKITINGVVVRSSGKRTTWLNGVAQNEHESPSGVSVSTSNVKPGEIFIQTSELAKSGVRVGETVNRNSGASRDLLEGGKIVIHTKAGRDEARR
ncbi:MAG: hypothetical protein V4623_03665 [Pseudomonadota bacterium]